MLQSMTIDGLKASPFTMAAFNHRPPRLTRSCARLLGVITGDCVIRFTQGTELAFHWRAEGAGSVSLASYCITLQSDRDPVLVGVLLLCAGGAPVAWDEQRNSLVDLLQGLEWQRLVLAALLAAYPGEYES